MEEDEFPAEPATPRGPGVLERDGWTVRTLAGTVQSPVHPSSIVQSFALHIQIFFIADPRTDWLVGWLAGCWC